MAVVALLHDVEDASLHGLQTVLNVRNGTFEDYITGIVNEPVLIHSRELEAFVLLSAFSAVIGNRRIYGITGITGITGIAGIAGIAGISGISVFSVFSVFS